MVLSPHDQAFERLLANTVGGVVSPGKDIVEIVPRAASRAVGSAGLSATMGQSASTTVSEIRSATLSGCPSETLSEVKRKEERAAKRGSCQCQTDRHIKICLYVQVI